MTGSESEQGRGDHESPPEDDRPGTAEPDFAFTGMPGLGELFGGARQHFEQAAHEAGDVQVRGSAGGDTVTIELTGNLEVVSVRIAPEAIDPEDPSILEDLLTAALRDALSAAVAVREQAATSLLPPGMDLGAMVSGLFGGGPGQPAGLPDLSGLDLGGIDFGELMGGLFGSEEEDEEGDDEPGGQDWEQDEQP